MMLEVFIILFFCHILSHNMQFFSVSRSHSCGISLFLALWEKGEVGAPHWATEPHGGVTHDSASSLGYVPLQMAVPAMIPDTGSVALAASALLPRLKSRDWKENKSPSPKQTLPDTPCLYNLSLLAGVCGVVPAGIPTQGYSFSPAPAILLTRDVFLSHV